MHVSSDLIGNVFALGLQPYPQKVVRPPKPTPTIFSRGSWSPRVDQKLVFFLELFGDGTIVNPPRVRGPCRAERRNSLGPMAAASR